MRTRTRSNSGVTTMPRRLPKAELKIAPASLPPTALVRMTAEETGGGMQPMTMSLGPSEPTATQDMLARSKCRHSPREEIFFDVREGAQDGDQGEHDNREDN